MSEPKPSERSRLRLWLALGAVVAVVALSVVLPLSQWLLALAEWIRGRGVLGMLAFSAVYVGGTVLFVPGSVLTLAAGFAYGPVLGTLIVWLSATAGAAAAFGVARYAGGPWVEERVRSNPKFAAIDRAVADQGFKVVLLLRLSPIFPFNLLNYALGLTRIRFPSYVLASSIGMLPGTAMYVYLGSLVQSATALSSGAPAGGGAQQALYWGGLVATIAATLFITRIARQALQGALSAQSVSDG